MDFTEKRRRRNWFTDNGLMTSNAKFRDLGAQSVGSGKYPENNCNLSVLFTISRFFMQVVYLQWIAIGIRPFVGGSCRESLQNGLSASPLACSYFKL